MLTRLLRTHLRRYPGPVAIVVVLQLTQTTAALYLPTLNADIIDRGVILGDTHHILRTGALMLAVTLAQVLCAVGAVFFAARTAMAVGRDLRAEVFRHVHTFSGRELAGFGAPSLVTRVTNDVQQVQTVALLAFTLLLPTPVTCLGGIVLALRQDVPLTALLLVIVPILIGLVVLITSRMAPLFRSMQERVDRINRVLLEQITGIRVIRAFVREEYEGRRFAKANTGLMTVGLGTGRLMALMTPAIMLVINLSAVAVLWFGGHRVAAGMPIGALTAFLSYLMQILIAVMMATFLFVMVPRAEVCAGRIQEVLDTRTSLAEAATPVTAVRTRGRLELRDVGYRYPGARAAVLDGVRLETGPGRTTAVIGGIGAGKTTLLQLIPRLTDATSGEVLVNGVDVRELDPALLARTVGLVPQRPYLFTGTVATNLRYGNPDATDAELWHALEVAQADTFVARLEGGLHAPVAQGGTNVSGGQRQRLAIARTLVAKPEIFLFDDCFSALDRRTAAALRAALARETADAAVVIVSQSVSAIRDADRIVVLDEGRAVGSGTHHDLMSTNATYREIVFSQLSEGEAAV